MTFEELRECLLAVDAGRLGLEQLRALLRAVPTQNELQELNSYMQVRGAAW